MYSVEEEEVREFLLRVGLLSLLTGWGKTVGVGWRGGRERDYGYLLLVILVTGKTFPEFAVCECGCGWVCEIHSRAMGIYIAFDG